MPDNPVVTYGNFARVESERMFTGVVANAGGTNVWGHLRVPTPIDEQTVIRMNRDTLYSAAIIDVQQGATITIPDVGDRYFSVMLVTQDHYVTRIIHEPGTHALSADELGSDFVLAAARILVDSEDPSDVARVNALQDHFAVTSTGGSDFHLAPYDQESFDRTRAAILELAAGLPGYDGAFGTKEEVDPVVHLLGAASGWGGLPETEATYVNVDPRLPVGEYSLTVGDVPVDGFWSLSLYNADGFFAHNDVGAKSVNSVTGVRNDDGTITVRFGGDPTAPNALPIMDGWNYLVRLYRPRPEILDGSWTFPQIEAS